jgi:transcriptional antiterminator RfaH
MINTPSWYVLYTKSRHEKRIASILNQKKIPAFLPLNRKLKQWHDRKKIVEEPLFPSYLFVFLESIPRYFDCLENDGALYFVRTGKYIVPVKEALIEQLKTIVCNTRDIEVSSGYIQPGQHVTIVNGPLTGVSGEVMACHNKNKIVVKVELLNRNLIINIPEESVYTDSE